MIAGPLCGRLLCIFLCTAFPRPSLWVRSEWVTDGNGMNLGLGQDRDPREVLLRVGPVKPRRPGGSLVWLWPGSGRGAPSRRRPARLHLVLCLPLRREYMAQNDDVAALTWRTSIFSFTSFTEVVTFCIVTSTEHTRGREGNRTPQYVCRDHNRGLLYQISLQLEGSLSQGGYSVSHRKRKRTEEGGESMEKRP